MQLPDIESIYIYIIWKAPIKDIYAYQERTALYHKQSIAQMTEICKAFATRRDHHAFWWLERVQNMLCKLQENQA